MAFKALLDHLRRDEKAPIFEGNTYILKLELYKADKFTRQDISGATWMACAIYDENDETKDVVQKSLGSGVVKTDALEGEATATFLGTDTEGLLRPRQKVRIMRYEWRVVIGVDDKTVLWGYVPVLPTGATSS